MYRLNSRIYVRRSFLLLTISRTVTIRTLEEVNTAAQDVAIILRPPESRGRGHLSDVMCRNLRRLDDCQEEQTDRKWIRSKGLSICREIE
uniref:Uncharacterized protein n=1 Tax=Noccaea caerulescens TaxID=107243 RepID=A0A1J3ILI0_NOCCA